MIGTFKGSRRPCDSQSTPNPASTMRIATSQATSGMRDPESHGCVPLRIWDIELITSDIFFCCAIAESPLQVW